MYFFMIVYSLNPTKEGEDFYLFYIFLLDYSLISIMVEFLRVDRWNFVTIFTFDYPNLDDIFYFDKYSTPLFYIFYTTYSSPSRFMHFISISPKLSNTITFK